jgi:hypothetical protein
MKRIRNKEDEDFYIHFSKIHLKNKMEKLYNKDFLCTDLILSGSDDVGNIFLLSPFCFNHIFHCLFQINIISTIHIESVENFCANFIYGSIL